MCATTGRLLPLLTAAGGRHTRTQGSCSPSLPELRAGLGLQLEIEHALKRTLRRSCQVCFEGVDLLRLLGLEDLGAFLACGRSLLCLGSGLVGCAELASGIGTLGFEAVVGDQVGRLAS